MVSFRHTGAWGPGEIDVRWVRSTRVVVPEVEAMIDRAWDEAMRRPGVHLFESPLCRLERSSVSPPPEGQRLHLELSPTSYKVFLGTNMAHPELADRHGPGILANPLGVSAPLETA